MARIQQLAYLPPHPTPHAHTNHVDKRDVEEEAASNGQDPAVGLRVLPQHNSKHKPQIANTCRQEVEQQRPLHAHPRVQQDSHVS